MTPEEFVRGLWLEIVEWGMIEYKQMYMNHRPDEATDPTIKRALTLFHNLTGDQQVVILHIIKQIQIDTVASVLSIIDGTRVLEGFSEEFVLRYKDGLQLNGNLTDIFLQIDEENEKGFGNRI